MENVVLVIHLILALAIIGLVLLQRSEGGGLGIGGGGGGLGGFASVRQTANVLTRATVICAICFFITSLALAILAGGHKKPESVLEALDNPAAVLDSGAQALENLQNKENDQETSSGTPSVPLSE